MSRLSLWLRIGAFTFLVSREVRRTIELIDFSGALARSVEFDLASNSLERRSTIHRWVSMYATGEQSDLPRSETGGSGGEVGGAEEGNSNEGRIR